MIESVAEAHLLADKVGLPAKSVHEMIDSVWSGPFSIYSERMHSGGYYQRKVKLIAPSLFERGNLQLI